MAQNRGTTNRPWVVFADDLETGISVVDGKVIFILGGRLVDDFQEWLDGIHKDGHIDALTKWAIIAATATGESTVGALYRRFTRGRA